ncbi:MAG: dipeptide epimerase [Planctomycetota bacterium]|nr:dipeptide epimerase [Planctomycetota bacterium]MDA1162428.1 dipeptide epimerase [Planctomycetota bacterium]
MRIAELIAYHVQIPLKTKIRHASYARRMTDSVVVRCVLSDGTEGWGEGLPREYVTGETIDSAFELLRATPLPQQLGAELESLEAAVELCEKFALTRPQHDPRNCFGNSIRCAVELSILDAVCRATGVPLSDVTKLYGPAVGVRQSQDQVRYSAVITSISPIRQRLRSVLIRLFGFHQTKVKVGVEGVDDAVSLRRIRRRVGAAMDIRIDANEAWNCENLEAQFQRLADFGITSIEQPVRHEQVDGLSVLRSSLSAPIMLDESLCSLEDARRAIEHGTCDLFNIRLSKCGGFLNSLKIAATAHQAGLGYQLGCQVGETGILSAAGRHFASSVGGIRYLEGSFDSFLVKERLTRENLTFGYRGLAPALTGPGLGVSVDEVALKRVTAAEEHFAI